MLTLTMDDGRGTQYTLARPSLLAHHFPATMFLITSRVGIGWSDYLTLEQAQSLAADGDELGSHSVDHAHLTTLTDAQVDDELRLSQEWLQSHLGVTAASFAAPFGEYDARVLGLIERHYRAHGTVNPGLNFPGADVYQLARDTIVSDTTPAQVVQLVRQAQAARGWVVLVFHDFTTAAPSDRYQYRASDFDQVLDGIAASGIEVVTFSQGAQRMRCAR